MKIKILYFSNALDHPLTSRMHFFIRFLKKRKINAKVFDVSFYYKKQSSLNFIKNVFSFPSKVFNKNNGTIQLPSLPLVGQRTSAIRPLLNSLYTLIAFLLTRISSKSLEYNVIVSADPVSALIANFARKTNTFVVYDDLDYFEDLKTGRILRFVISILEKLAIIKANLVVSVSKPLMKRAQKLNQNCILVPNGANLENFPNPQNTDRAPIIVYAGTMDEWAGLKLVIEAFPIIKKKFPWLKMQIIGDGKEKKSLESLVSSLSLQKHILFIGRLPYSKMAESLCKSYIGIAMFKPGNAANFASPLKLFDYMGAGLSVIATNVGDIGRIVKESKSGFAINWNIVEFAEVVEQIINNQKLWQKFHENGLKYVKNYDWETLFSVFILEIEKRIQKQNT